MKNENPILKDLESLKYYPYTKRRTYLAPHWHKHNFWEIAYLINGNMTNNLENGDTYEMSARTISIIRPDDYHIYSKLDSVDYRDIYISCEEMKRICSRFNDSLYDYLLNLKVPLTFKLTLPMITQLEESISKLDDVITITKEYDSLLEMIVYRIISFYFELNTVFSLNKDMPEIVYKILKTIKNNPMDESYKKFIENSGYSKGHICRLFKDYVGSSIRETICNEKVIFSVGLLSNKTYTIDQISNMLGYSNSSNFSNAFKLKFGVSPKEYRKRIFN